MLARYSSEALFQPHSSVPVFAVALYAVTVTRTSWLSAPR